MSLVKEDNYFHIIHYQMVLNKPILTIRNAVYLIVDLRNASYSLIVSYKEKLEKHFLFALFLLLICMPRHLLTSRH